MNRPLSPNQHFFQVARFNLAATFDSGQAFRWQQAGGGWEGIVAGRWIRLTPVTGGLRAEIAAPVADWQWLSHYLRLHEDPDAVRATLPPDAALFAALDACAGLRLLRQEPWECLASFLLSSTKQIVQIRQIVATLCARFGDAIAVPPGNTPAFSFPSPTRLAACSEDELRTCKMGFRARYLREAARRIAAGEPDLAVLPQLPLTEARSALLEVPGIGPKIADCVLLFSLGFDQAFPVDVWMARTLRQLYFPRCDVTLHELRAFSETHFGPHAGYAQQCLFHHARTLARAAGST